MTSLAAPALNIRERGLIRPGSYADIAVFDEPRIRDRATYEDPHRYSKGTVHVLVNGRFAIRHRQPTGVLAGKPSPKAGAKNTRRAPRRNPHRSPRPGAACTVRRTRACGPAHRGVIPFPSPVPATALFQYGNKTLPPDMPQAPEFHHPSSLPYSLMEHIDEP